MAPNQVGERENFLNLTELALVWVVFVGWFTLVPRLPWQPLWIFLTLLLSLALQQYFSGVQHEAAHGNFLRGYPRANDHVANWFASYIFSYPVSQYRIEHFRHHAANVWFVPEDKETAARASLRTGIVRGVLRDFFFLSALDMFVIRNSGGERKPILEMFAERGPVILHFFLLWGCLAHFGSLVYVGVFFFSFVTLYFLSQRVRAWGTHGDIYEEEGIVESKVARNVMSPWYERIFVGNRMMMYHFEHHENPTLSFRECEKGAIARSEEQPDQFNTHTPSYWFFARHFLAGTFVGKESENRSFADRGRRFRGELLPLIACLAVALPLLLLWHWKNSVFPHGDEAEFATIAMRMYKKFSSGFFSGMKEVYCYRSWKPILVPPLGVPFYFLSSGKVLPAMLLYAIGVQSALAVSVYALARFFLRRWDSVIVVAILLNLPVILHSSHWISSESVFFVFGVAFGAALLRTRGFRRRWPAVFSAILFALAACVRPAESALILGVPLLAYVGFCLRRCKLQRSDLERGVLFFGLPLISLGIAFAITPLWSNEVDLRALLISPLGAIAASSLYLMAPKLRSRVSCFPLFALIAASIICIWFGPCPGRLWNWIHHAGFQPTVNGNLNARMGIQAAFRSFYHDDLGLWGLQTFALAVLFRLFFRRRSQTVLRVLAAVLLGLSIHLCLYALSFNQDSRYFILESFELIFFAMVLMLSQDRWRGLWRLYLVLSLVLLVSIQLPELGVPSTPAANKFHDVFGSRGFEDPPSSNRFGFTVYRKILEKLGTRTTARVLIHLTDDRGRLNDALDPFSMDLIAWEDGREDLKFTLPPLGNGHEWLDWNPRRPGWVDAADFYFIGPIEDEKVLKRVEQDKHPLEELELFPDAAPLKFLWVHAKEQT